MARPARRDRVREKVRGTDRRPRLSVFRSNKYLYVQVISDESGRTLVADSTLKDLGPGVNVSVEKQTVVTIAGIDRRLVGEVAADIRKLRPPEPYKAKGVRYSHEHIRRKAGKAGAAK